MWSKVIAVLMLSLVMLLAPAEAAYTYNDKGLLIVTTFPNLVWDIKQLVCKDDRVKSIVPLGVDPHEYQLTPSDIQLLAKADIIVSTAHTPFEEDIRSLTLEGKLYATLIEIPRIPGIRILRNPVTGQPNYHMLIYDPENYKIFLIYIVKVLSEKRPECSKVYGKNLNKVIAELTRIVSMSPKLNIDAAADMPLTQYGVSWLGVRIRYLVVKEHGVAVSPSMLRDIENGAEKGSIGLIVVVWPLSSKASEALKNIALRHSVPVLYVPSPFTKGTILNKLANISLQARSLEAKLGQRMAFHEGASAAYLHLLLPVSGIFGLAALGFLAYYITRGGGR